LPRKSARDVGIAIAVRLSIDRPARRRLVKTQGLRRKTISSEREKRMYPITAGILVAFVGARADATGSSAIAATAGAFAAQPRAK
jgi:hypothetical protein